MSELVEILEIGTEPVAELLELAPDDASPLAGAEVLSVEADPLTGGATSARYEHTQVAEATVWIVDHNLGRRPVAWSLFDSSGRLCRDYVVELPTVNRLIVRTDIPVAGLFRCVA